MRSFLPFVVSFVATIVGATSHASAADAWRATQVAGEVRVEIGSGPAVPLTVAMAIEHEALIETAASGTATLVRGEEHVTVAPNSRLRLPADDSTGFTRIIEEFGQLFFQVGKKTTPHFRVETPMLAATVKGTAFIVTVDEKSASVEVKEGVVLVQNNASADQAYVAAGRSASVTAAEPMTLYLDHTVVPPADLRLGDRSIPPASPASGGAELSGAPSATAELGHRGKPQTSSTTTVKVVPLAGIAAAQGDVHRKPMAVVLDSTLFGVGVGILAAALAIIFIGTSRRPPGIVSAKRVARDEPRQGA
jgi:hypothetical protein